MLVLQSLGFKNIRGSEHQDLDIGQIKKESRKTTNQLEEKARGVQRFRCRETRKNLQLMQIELLI